MEVEHDFLNPANWLVNQKHFNFITNSFVHRQIELDVRKDLREAYDEMQANLKKLNQRIKLSQLSIPAEIRNVKFSDILKDTGENDFQSIMKKLIELSDAATTPSSRKTTNSSNESTSTGGPRVARMQNLLEETPSNFKTPENNFLHTLEAKLPTTVKKQPPRLAKPGEMVYAFSATGSPVIPPNSALFSSKRMEPTETTRVKFATGDGKTIDIDLVFRDAPMETKNEFTTDLRCWAKGWTTARAKKVATSRIAKNKAPGSAKAKHVRF